MTRNRIDQDGEVSEEVRYFIVNFKAAVELFACCVRRHWAIESYHWLLDIVYREDHNQPLNKTAATNLNALRKICLHLLRTLSFPKKNLSYKRKTKSIASHPEVCLK
ncbi:transposase DDE domain protein [Streptococcus troglodytae]|uniref:Transposase DDE domain protein n=1 Tax=Streptococcus troglodytae TaxID=1111760 RepID=A0A1L7LGQ4_9STRE|nr:transposase DDE domain protein [Streptococcus troglodytae]